MFFIAHFPNVMQKSTSAIKNIPFKPDLLFHSIYIRDWLIFDQS